MSSGDLGGEAREGPAELELTVLMPCLNEARSLGHCIARARDFIERAGLRGEVLISDNGSDDGSRALAAELGARVVTAPRRGYGEALRTGILAARGALIVMGDADGSYDFSQLDPYLAALNEGADLVIGNRFEGGIEAGAMPPLHQRFGNPFLSWMGRAMFALPLGDFHCGLRGLRRAAFAAIDARAPGMEFASELIIRAHRAGLVIAEVPTTLSRDLRGRPPHLRSWRDGLRHLRLRLAYQSRWSLIYPGLIALIAGLALTSSEPIFGLGLILWSLLAFAAAAALGSARGLRGAPPRPGLALALALVAGLASSSAVVFGAPALILGMILGLGAWVAIALSIRRRPGGVASEKISGRA